MPAAVDFVLIHGTFAQGAHWTDRGSTLCKALLATYPDANIERFSWSGDNLQESREAEVEDFVSWFDSLQKRPGAKYVLIAHSHGGNIALSACADKRLYDHVKCLICLATPFVTHPVPGESNFLDRVRFWLTLMPIMFALQSLGSILFCPGAFPGRSLDVFAALLCMPILWGSATGLLQLRLLIVKWLRACAALRSKGDIPCSVPIINLTSRGDEVMIYLVALDVARDVLRSLGTLLPLIAASWITIGFRGYSGDPSCTDFLVGPFGAFFAGGRVVDYGLAFLVAFAFGIALDVLWALLVIVCFHLLRGDAFLSRFGGRLSPTPGFRFLFQPGFGESPAQTLFGLLSASTRPWGVANLRTRYCHFPRRNSPLLHCSIYESEEVIRTIEWSASANLDAPPDRGEWWIEEQAEETEEQPLDSGPMEGFPLETSVFLDGATELFAVEADYLVALLRENGVDSMIVMENFSDKGYSVQVPAPQLEEALRIMKEDDFH